MAAFHLLYSICVGLTVGVCRAADPYNYFDLELSYITVSPLGVQQQVSNHFSFLKFEHCPLFCFSN